MSFRLLATIEFGKQAIGGLHQIVVLRQVVRSQGHPTREFRHELRPIPIRKRVETSPLQPRRLMIAPAADGCKRFLFSLGGCLLESQGLASNEEAKRLLQASGLRLLVLGGLDPADIPSTM